MSDRDARQPLVVVALDAAEGEEYAIELARELARTEAPELLGVFVENQELLEYARSRRTREILLTGQARSLDPEALERQLRSQAARARASFEAATSRLGLRHRFEVARGEMLAEAIRRAAMAEALVFSLTQASGVTGVPSRGFSRQLIEAALPRVLLTREGWFTGQSIAVMLEDVATHEPLLEAAAAISRQSRSPLTALIPATEETDRAAPGLQIDETLRRHGIDRSSIIRLSGTTIPGIAQAARVCRARLLVMRTPTEPGESESLDELLRRFPGAVMLVRP